MNFKDVLNSPLQSATLAARDRTGKLIATAVEQGRFQVQEIALKKGGDCDVIPLSEFLPLDRAIDALNAL